MSHKAPHEIDPTNGTATSHIPGMPTPPAHLMAMYGYGQYPPGYGMVPPTASMAMPPRPVLPSTAAALLGMTPSTPAVVAGHPAMAYPRPPMMPPMMPAMPTMTTTTTLHDPNNDITCWLEYHTDDKVKYWYNKVTQVSTYDKPFCLKTPEERAIPPCSWKEYKTADGKSYYSNGQDTRYLHSLSIVSK